mgnify:FL=1
MGDRSWAFVRGLFRTLYVGLLLPTSNCGIPKQMITEITNWISMALWVDGPVTAAMTAGWVQGYFILTGVGSIYKLITKRK